MTIITLSLREQQHNCKHVIKAAFLKEIQNNSFNFIPDVVPINVFTFENLKSKTDKENS